MNPIHAIVPAAGAGRRARQADHELPKQYRLLAGEPVLHHTVRALLSDPRIHRVHVAVSAEDDRAAALFVDWPQVTIWQTGGAERADTVRQTLQAIDIGADDWVLVHDAARPALPRQALSRLIDACLREPVGGLLAWPVSDTVKQAGGSEPLRVDATLDRRQLWLAQTPQMFRAGILLKALQQALAQGGAVTDEASAIEALGLSPRLVTGAISNQKLTWPEDFARMEAMLEQPSPPWRVGQGFDVHALVEGRPLILGGVSIPHTHGLLGHSDADALLHAITDAILGAAGLGDIGRHFPDSDPRFAGIDSRDLLRAAHQRVREAGWMVVNIDATIHAQAPRIGPYAAAMVANIAADCAIAPNRVNVKGKTNESLGFLGRREGIAVTCVAMLQRCPPASAAVASP
jgi:2-C-methyl-D-erythritol 4-phosphate cytidylyltransferase/2-C-methyl-D-erythritol 2,4-cyclodiphosphate synthase